MSERSGVAEGVLRLVAVTSGVECREGMVGAGELRGFGEFTEGDSGILVWYGRAGREEERNTFLKSGAGSDISRKRRQSTISMVIFGQNHGNQEIDHLLSNDQLVEGIQDNPFPCLRSGLELKG